MDRPSMGRAEQSAWKLRIGRDSKEMFKLLQGLRHERRGSIRLLLALTMLLPGRQSWAQDATSDLADVDIEQLMSMEVTSVSGRATKISHTASAIHVVTAEDIRRSGATSIPEALRMVPGLHVAQITDNLWTISSRGLGFRYANKLQVLVDGRSLYTPANGGVDWNVHNMMLDDIERIEVIRGPGASLWGGNAFNGVINIITRHSRDTQGGLLTTSVGSHQRVHSSLQYGGRLAPNATYRFGAQFFDRKGSQQLSGEPARDGGDLLQGSFRADWAPSPSDQLLFTGSLEDRDTDNLGVVPLQSTPFDDPIVFSRLEWKTSSVMGRWQRYFTRGDEISLQASYDWLTRDDPTVTDTRETLSLDFRHHLPVGNRQDLLWGIGFNRFNLDSHGSPNFSFGHGEEEEREHSDFDPFEHHDADSRYVLFAQNEIALVPEKLFLIPGARLQHETDSGWNFQPSIRALWAPNPRHSFWGAVSRALRTPSEVEEHSHIVIASLGFFGPQPAYLSLVGNQEFQSEQLLAYELGYRTEPRPGLSFDVTTFFNVYDDLATAERTAPVFIAEPPFPRIEVPLRFENKMNGEIYGMELSANWRVNRFWSVGGSYSRLEIQLHLQPDSLDTESERLERSSPDHQFSLRSQWQLPRNLELNSSLYYVAGLPLFPLPAYTRLDAQLTWRPLEQVAFTVGGQNLLDPRHPEFGRLSDFTLAGQAERNIFAKLSWRF